MPFHDAIFKHMINSLKPGLFVSFCVYYSGGTKLLFKGTGFYLEENQVARIVVPRSVLTGGEIFVVSVKGFRQSIVNFRTAFLGQTYISKSHIVAVFSIGCICRRIHLPKVVFVSFHFVISTIGLSMISLKVSLLSHGEAIWDKTAHTYRQSLEAT